MTDFHEVVVSSVHKETSDTVVLEFDIPDALKSHFAFTQGQHLTLRAIIDGEDVRRTYSLCTSPDEGVWKVAVKRIPGGIFSTYANKVLKAGDTVQLMKPSGHFHVEVNPGKKNNYLAFAAGSGITPILSIIKTHLEREPESTFKLFYLNKTSKSIIFKEEIEQLKNSYFKRFHVFHFLTKEKRDIDFLNGRFDEHKMAILTKTFIDIEDTAHCFLCGPQEMIFFLRDSLKGAGLDESKIHYELFFGGDLKGKDLHVAEILESREEGTDITIIDGGKEFHFVMNQETDNILDAALLAGADLPYACKGGVCSTCKCKLIDGDVEMKVNYALEQEELDQNFILSCQSVPKTEKIIVDFDV